MKLFHLNFTGIVLLLAVLFVLVLVPSFIIQNIWNSMSVPVMEKDLSIEIWQAALLWGAMLSAIYMTGIFQFKLNFKTLDSIDLDTINDPELREEIERLKLQAQKEEKKDDEPNK